MSEAPTSPTSTEAGALLFPDQAAQEAAAAASEAPTETPEGDPPAETPPVEEPSTESTEPSSEAPSPEPIDPASYSFKLPEGFTEDADLDSSARQTFATLGIKPTDAQPLVDLFSSALKRANDVALSAWQAEQTEWLTAIDANPDFQGPTREKSLTAISRLFDTYGSAEAKEALNRGGIGNNPALAVMMLKVAQALDEGTPATSGRPAPNGRDGRPLNNRSAGQILFPDAPN